MKAQGCAAGATLGQSHQVIQPQRGCAGLRNPVGVGHLFSTAPRVAPLAQPWAGLRSPVGAFALQGYTGHFARGLVERVRSSPCRPLPDREFHAVKDSGSEGPATRGKSLAGR
jgi:hypothetical protein